MANPLVAALLQALAPIAVQATQQAVSKGIENLNANNHPKTVEGFKLAASIFSTFAQLIDHTANMEQMQAGSTNQTNGAATPQQ